MPLTSGTLICKQRYLLITIIGSGNNAGIWLAYDRQTNGYCAIKTQYPSQFTGALNEIAILETIDHPSCIKLLNKFPIKCGDDKYVCSVFPLCSGTIGELLESHNYSISLSLVKKWTRQILEGLAHVHANDIVHTDIKPDNILISGVSETVQSYIRCFEQTGFKTKRVSGTKLTKLARECTSIFGDELCESSEDESSEEEFSDEDRDQSVEDESCYVSDVYDLDELYTIEPKNTNKIMVEGNAIIADFGNAMFTEELTTNEIQDRLYRAPEIILDLPYDQTVDIWSVGCCVFEMITGSYLMSFRDHDSLNDDLQQLYLLQKFIGPIPESLKRQSRRYECLFDDKRGGEIRGVATHLTVGLKETLANYGFKDDDTVRFLSRLLSYEDRPSATELLSDPWFGC